MQRTLLAALTALTYAQQNTSRIEYNVLIVGDVHDDLAAIDELRSRLGRQSRKYHLLLCTGDLTTMPHGNVDGSAKPEATPHTNAFVRKASEAARALATLAPLVYSCRAPSTRSVCTRPTRACPQANLEMPTTSWRR